MNKHIIRIGIAVFAFYALALASCDKKDGGGVPPPPEVIGFANGTISLNENGDAWESDSTSNLIVINNGTFTLQASGSNRSLILNIDSFAGVGDFYLSEHQGNFGIYNDFDSSVSYYDGLDGNIGIEEYSETGHRISGNFTLDAENLIDTTLEIDITEGIMDNIPVWYIRDIANEDFTFTVDGENYIPDQVKVNVIPFDKSVIIDYDDLITSEDGSLKFPYDIEIGTYDYSEDDLGPIYFWYDSRRPINGNLIITQNDTVNHHIEGLFDLDVQNLVTLEISSIIAGQFSIDY